MALALTVGVLIGGGVFMMLRRGMVRLIIGFALLSHGVNLLIMSTGGIDRRGEPLGSSPDPATTADALPQAFVLTAIVIAFAITMYMLVLAVTGDEDDDTDLELTGREMETPDLMDDPADSTGTHGAAPADPDPVGTRPERRPGRGGRA
ncbi:MULTISPECIES: sodium:proton antiporter [Kocuria]|uniref:sodium:proton antiporter n=1 Tax=Kocuria TaxID=57493 RepID=UPI000D649C66|nr:MULTISPECIES: cation:proton antiporter subunit C [Kocuria]NVC22367.1 cation:proton antiporter [Kocuria salina]PWF87633.1 cation:proton antiporter [Kocuria rosea]STX03775.1 Multiple resistance and pH homeostasis protein C [Kocuria rosea]